MILEERDLGFRSSPEVRDVVETVFAQALNRHADRVRLVRIRMIAMRAGQLQCRARLFPLRGRTIIATALSKSAVDAVHATASTLTRLLVKQLEAPQESRRIGRNRQRARHEDDGEAFVAVPHSAPARDDDDFVETLAEECVADETGTEEPESAIRPIRRSWAI